MIAGSHLATYPASCDPRDVLATLDARRNTFLFTDIMAAGVYPEYLRKMWKDKDIQPDIREGELELIRDNTVDYIGFSYYYSNVCNAADGAEFFEGTLTKEFSQGISVGGIHQCLSMRRRCPGGWQKGKPAGCDQP